MTARTALILLALLSNRPFALTQETATSTTGSSASVASSVPRLIRFSGVAKDATGKSLTGTIGITFLLYKDQEGGAPLWMETQNVQPDANGRYTVQLGATQANGLPTDVFASGEARWLGVQAQGQAEQPRVMLLAVPYALKAADAETIGGLPPSAFVLAAPPASTGMAGATSQGATVQPLVTGTKPVTTAGGTQNRLPKFDATADITNSQIFDNGTNVGIGNTAPAAKLDVSGTGIFRGLLSLPATGTATPTAGKNSQPFNFTASSFNSGTAGAVNQVFRWQAEAAGNNTTTPSGTLNLLYGSGTAVPTETGLNISNKGVITFASAQTFPPTVGTVKSVGMSAPASDFTVSGSPVTQSGTLGLNWNVAPTSANTANAIVKRDSSGSFFVNGISGTGQFSTSTTGTFASGMSATISGTSSFGVSGSASGVKSAGVGGIDTDPRGIGVLGQNGRTSDEFSVRFGQYPVGVWADSTNFGLVATSDTNAVVAFNNNSNASTIFAQNDSSNPGGLLFYATDPNVTINGSSSLFTIQNTGQVGMGTGSPAATLHINEGGNASNDSLLIGNNTTKGLQLRDTGSAVDLESFGVPLFVNNVTQQPVNMNLGGGPVYIGPGALNAGSVPRALNVGALQNGGNFLSAVFSNDVLVGGNFYVNGTKNFRIDHPLDPTNKYLYHAAIESSEVLNLYKGNAILDENGEARIELPAWVEALNTDFSYQLTAIGAPGPNLYILEEIKNNRFSIAGGAPGMKVSWQVTCQRNDAYMKAHPFVAERDKPANERGHYKTYQLSEKDAFPYRK